ncbi:MmyB family transcriptional regulator [Saccharothrix sp. Mg75]|uniref:MmyB family transcriptional regulator n=1 Tax=Saccharothrix sp. Mg75 TaxID=3445357 RepID=UPI003EEC1B14
MAAALDRRSDLRQPSLRRAPGRRGTPVPGQPVPAQDHRPPGVGPITLDCDTLLVAMDDLRITVYTAETGTEDADRLAPAVVLGTQSLQL